MYGAFDTLMEPQAEAIIRHSIRLVDQAFKTINLSDYHVISGPTPFRIRVSKTPIDLSVSAILRSTKRKTIHFIDFTPYDSAHSMRWDIPTHLKIKHLNRYVPKHSGRKVNVVAHIFGVSKLGDQLIYSNLEDNQVDSQLLKRSLKLIQNMERGYKMPLIPCPYRCQFKSRCSP